MIIRPCKEDDIDFITNLEKSSFETSFWNKDQFLYEFKENDYANIFVAEMNGVILGYIDFWILFEQGTIAKIAVNKALRNKGIGNVLMLDSINRMKEQGVISITLEVRVSNTPAINLYKKHGFEIVHTKKNYYQDGEDAYLMLLNLGEENG